MRISDWSSDVCSSDLNRRRVLAVMLTLILVGGIGADAVGAHVALGAGCRFDPSNDNDGLGIGYSSTNLNAARRDSTSASAGHWNRKRSEEHTSELQSLMRISYAVFCLKKTKH